MDTRTQSLWLGTHHLRQFPPLARPLEVDVDRLAAGETGHTTSHLTEAVDARYETLRRDCGQRSPISR